MASRTTTKITAGVLKAFAKGAEPNSKIWDTELKGFHALKTTTGISYRLFYRNAEGKQKTLTIGRYPALTADQARELARQMIGRVSAGEDVLEQKQEARRAAKRQQQQSLGAYIVEVYEAHQRRRKSGELTIKMLRTHFATWLDKPMDAITPRNISRWQAEQETAGLAFETSKRIFGALKTCLNHAVKTGTIDSHQLTKCQLEKPHLTDEELAEAGTARRYLSEDETKALFDGIDAYQEEARRGRRNSRSHGKAHLPDLDTAIYVDHVKPWILTMFYCGFRPGDLFGLRWEHVNLNFGTIRKVIEKTAHHQSDPRTFPISKPLIQVLTVWHEQRGKPTSGYVFPSASSKSGRMDKHAMQKPWRKVREFAGLSEDLQLYTLRHNFASQLILAGADLLTVSKLMAHEDIQTTIKHYGHLRPDLAREYIERFAASQTPDIPVAHQTAESASISSLAN
ncbi:site-specific integrase [Marinobacterium sp. D7]|uniref:site-specific integrase n=1 Tax=Marinobacterium ramblicola TaxID=2849041 RepID=UPI001C2CDDA2|nr:site-specific integrase [Marinobacterium ramblicola]MBV1788633.1 site-specific integrase [Marinobacterium ramblicola]